MRDDDIFKFKTFYKVFVTKDFPKIHEQRVFFEDNNTDNKTAIVKSGYWDNEPYCEHYIQPIVLKDGEWFWEIKDAKKDWVKRRKAVIATKLNTIAELNKQIKQLQSQKISKSDIIGGEFCEVYPDGKHAQIEREKQIEKKLKKRKLKKEIDEHAMLLAKKQAELGEI